MPKVEAVKWQAFDRAVTEAQGKFADMPAGELEATIEEAVAAARMARPVEDRDDDTLKAKSTL